MLLGWRGKTEEILYSFRMTVGGIIMSLLRVDGPLDAVVTLYWDHKEVEKIIGAVGVE